MKPLVAVSPSVNMNEDEIMLKRAYFSAVFNAGGIPMVTDLSGAKEIIKNADGIILSGGGDIDAELIGDVADKATQGQVSRLRDEYEFELMKYAVKNNIPVLGICRGMQVIGAYFGAHIIQHMEGHKQKEEKNVPSHYVNVKDGTLLHKIIGENRLKVNSYHHQAVGKGFRGTISAVSDDGFTEAVEPDGEAFILGVQWHPELLTEYREHQRIFSEFIKAAAIKRRIAY